MSNSEEPSNVDLQFRWGKKKGIGGAKKDVQFYESFTYDDVNYSLYDCVYLFKKDEHEAYIGKIVKIWEQRSKKKNVKILWFFRPNEIQNYLGDLVPLRNEIFLASGEGVGLSNVNPLEAIAGKCYVICTSMDKRNPQPSKAALEMADYIFYRTFDVGNYTVSDRIPDNIAGIEVKHLLNREDQNPNPFSTPNVNGILDVKTYGTSPVSHSLSQSDSLIEQEKKVKIVQLGRVPSPTLKDDVIEREHPTAVNLPFDEKSFPKSRSDSTGVGEASTPKVAHVEENVESSKHKAPTSLYDDKPSKKMRLSDDSVKQSEKLQNKNGSSTIMVKIDSGANNSGETSVQLHKGSSNKMKLSEKNAKPSDETLEKSSPAVFPKNDTKAEHQVLEVTRRPDADRSKWFKGLPWEERMQNANEQGTLVFLENLDRSYTATDIEDIIYHTFKQSCTVKVIPEATFHDPHYGQAYVIFRTRDAADSAVQRINTGCLMLPNGRPLIASCGMLKIPPKLPAFPGHLSIDKIMIQKSREEMKKALSTSHCSQPNTIEYELALEWVLAQEKSVKWFNQLFQGHANEIKQARNRLKTK